MSDNQNNVAGEKIDFSDPLACANYLAGIADRLNLAATRVETAKAAALSGNLANMDGFLENATQPAGQANHQLQTIRHERGHVGDQQRAKEMRPPQAKEFNTMPLDWDALPTTPPDEYMVFNNYTGEIRYRKANEWADDIAELDRDTFLLYDITGLGCEGARNFAWRMAEKGKLIGTQIAGSGKGE